MRNTIVLMLLVMVSSGAAAEWEFVSHSEPSIGITVYRDPATIRKSGDTVKMWIMFDFKTMQLVGGTAFLSEKDQTEYDCKGERLRILFATNHSGNMGSGLLTYTNNRPRAWEPVVPDTINERIWKSVCGKR